MRQEDINEVIGNSCPSWLSKQIEASKGCEGATSAMRRMNTILVANLIDDGSIHLNTGDAATVLTITRMYI